MRVIDVLPNEMLQAYLVNVLCRGEKNRWFCEVTHGVELRPFCCWMVQLIHLLASSSRHLALCSSSFLITCFSLSTLKKEVWIFQVSTPSLCSYFLTELLLLWKWSPYLNSVQGQNDRLIKVGLCELYLPDCTKTAKSCERFYYFNPLNTKRRLLYLKTQFVPRSKNFSSRL
jgi:hypothetical protein